MHIRRQVSVAKELRMVITHISEKKKLGIISVVVWWGGGGGGGERGGGGRTSLQK